MRMNIDKVKKVILEYGGEWIGNKYINNTTKLLIRCSICGKTFERTYATVKNNKNAKCRKCTCKENSLSNKSYNSIKNSIEDIEEYIIRCGGKWIGGEYKNCKSKLTLICPECHEKFEKTYSSIARNGNPCCKDCTRKINGVKKSKRNYRKMEDKINELGGKLIRFENGSGELLVYIRCSRCKEIFKTTGRGVLNRKSMHCFSCSRLDIVSQKRLSIDYVKEYIESLGGKLIGKEYENNSSYLKIACNKCGEVFERTFDVIKQYESVTCSNCKMDIPKGEEKIRDFLSRVNVKFIMQKMFDDCRIKQKLKFDFYLPEKNICIEFNGEQHYKPIKFYGGKQKFNKQKRIDFTKRNYCKEKNIKLIEIPYWKIKRIEEILERELNVEP